MRNFHASKRTALLQPTQKGEAFVAAVDHYFNLQTESQEEPSEEWALTNKNVQDLPLEEVLNNIK
ncbi:MAG TPA: hypothetical protein VNX68_00920, partial [Nitrosopumilaceae archaeon]|nr:hypothetical protein [Nitrosopumilaceae archaeon]